MSADTKKAHSFHPPILQGLLPIKVGQIPTEVIAGVTLAALAIPEVMGYTKIAGTPVITGLYTILVPMALYAIFGSSRHLVVGADSATAAVFAAGLVGLASVGSDEYLALAGVLAIMAAAFLIIARFVGLSFMADFLSRTVLVGFLTGVGIQVSFGEIGGLLGIAKGGHGTVEQLLHVFQNLGQTSLPTLALAAAVLAIIIGSKRISNKIPGALIAVIGAIVLSWALDLKSHGIAVLGAVASGLPSFGLPKVDWSWSLVAKLVPTAFSMFILILAQSAATSRAYASRYGERFDENVDLVGLGLANLGAGLSGTFAVNGSPTKTQMVDSAGGHSQLAQITTCILVLLVLLFLTGVLAYMPDAVLSAVVFLIGVALIDIKGMQQIYKERQWEFWVALITAAVVVLVGVEQGIILAIVLSLIAHTRHGYRPSNTVISHDEKGRWQIGPVSAATEYEPGLLFYRFTHGMYYANAEQLSQEVSQLVKQADPALSWLCIEASGVDDVDFSAAATLRSLQGSLKEKGIRLVMTHVAANVRAELDRSGITDLIGADAYYHLMDEVIDAYKKAK